jgi:hypothetical protein
MPSVHFLKDLQTLSMDNKTNLIHSHRVLPFPTPMTPQIPSFS